MMIKAACEKINWQFQREKEHLEREGIREQ